MDILNKDLLIIDDEENMRHMLTALLTKSGYRIDEAADGSEGLEKVRQKQYDFILCDLKMPNMDGMAFLREAGTYLDATTVIVMSAYGSIDTAIDAMKQGAYDYISKPFKSDEVCLALKKAEEREKLKRENFQLRERLKSIEAHCNFANMIGKSSAMQAIFRLSEKVAQYDTTVLVTGESGTGKELIARGIHFKSDRSQEPFIAVNCGGIPETLLESEFFGYRKGAFTGADRNKKGLFEEADGGTLFLDEIGELPRALQVKFLRVLQENEVRPIGASKTRKVNVRILAATSKNLEAEVQEGRFRQDLFYRLNVMPLRLPPLRERPEDIPLLCRHFIRRFNENLKENIEGISPEAMSILIRHKWPGNVRELENMIERAVILTDGAILSAEHFSLETGHLPEEDLFESLFEGYSLKAAQKILEKNLITKALSATGGNRTKATQLLEISHPSLLTKIKAYDISL
ncbi:sigma-54-dependent Fis family transcriptional re gulator [Desulfonema ishimotonii]|uniref:Sigma-54-dependent Fis family transcriptional re gulator n=1 Tax=Desulfonema ishimotonii TaxID=45657 RepID=A0A401FYQ0_9BACT|nr:sigma-54 dependent transcriptional regulator [Desulfonema ishimotonii]GBC62073.1 sigma-54-dependent Fis family transcriptional re gulator [Desulfonema ishimotonii]